MEKIIRISVGDMLFFALFFLLYMSGVFYNFSDIAFRSVFFDPVLLIITATAVLLALVSPKVNLEVFTCFAIYFLLAVGAFVVFIFGTNDLFERLLGYKNFIFYIGSFFAFYFITRNSYVRRIYISYVSFFMIVICGFGVLQSVLGHKLPENLLAVENVGLLPFAEAPEIVRPTGLIGNALEFAGFALIAFCYFYSRLLWQVGRKWYPIIGIVFSVLGIISSLSRVALITLLFALFFISLLKLFKSGRFRLRYVFLMCGAVITPLFLFLFFDESFLVKRFIDPDVNTVHSNIAHVEDYEAAVSAIVSSPLIGVGIGSQGISARDLDSKIITDGSWFVIALEFGLAVFLIYIFFLMLVLIKLFRKVFFDDLFVSSVAVFLTASLASLHVMGVTNSAYLSPVILVTLWGLVGVLFSEVDNILLHRG